MLMGKIINGISCGNRETRGDKIRCSDCGEFKHHEEFSIIGGKFFAVMCKACKVERVAMKQMEKRVEQRGVAAERAEINRLERAVKARKKRLQELINQKGR